MMSSLDVSQQIMNSFGEYDHNNLKKLHLSGFPRFLQFAAYSTWTITAFVNVAIFLLDCIEDDKVDLKQKKLNISLIFFTERFLNYRQ